MTQRRFIDFGSPVTSEKINTLSKERFDPNLLSGGLIETIRSDAVQLEPITILTPDGVMITESENQEIVFVLGTDPKDYTFIYRFTAEQISGGITADVEVVDNIFHQEDFTDATVLGWLKYPGGSVSLDDTMIYQPRPVKIMEPSIKEPNSGLEKVNPPFSNKWIDQGSTLPILITEEYETTPDYVGVHTQFINNQAIIINDIIRLFPFIAGEFPPSRLFLRVRAEFQASLLVTVFDEAGVEYTPTNNAIANTDVGGNIVFQNFEMDLQNFNGLGKFEKGSQYVVKLLIQLNPGKKLSIQHLMVSDFNIPGK